jgi:two-component system nitrogen regulation response regulator GlnG/two-component system response regulator HydG
LNHSSFEDGYESQSHRPRAWNLREQIAGAAQAKVQKILVLGESGTGKEATANAIHRLSKRANGPFVSRNAASFAMSVVDTELFGHPANFPSAGTPERKGLFGQADGGTLFFDEVADCPPEVQARLLRVLDKGEYQREACKGSRRRNGGKSGVFHHFEPFGLRRRRHLGSRREALAGATFAN